MELVHRAIEVSDMLHHSGQNQNIIRLRRLRYREDRGWDDGDVVESARSASAAGRRIRSRNIRKAEPAQDPKKLAIAASDFQDSRLRSWNERPHESGELLKS